MRSFEHLPSYDEDGNLKSAGRRDYSWSAENRLTRMTSTTAAANAGVPRQQLEFVHDSQGRRVAKNVSTSTHGTTWTFHETQAGGFDFKGEKDVMEFVRLCGAEEMKVIVRPDPYVCAEWDLGGLPAWLLKEPGIKVRS